MCSLIRRNADVMDLVVTIMTVHVHICTDFGIHLQELIIIGTVCVMLYLVFLFKHMTTKPSAHHSNWLTRVAPFSIFLLEIVYHCSSSPSCCAVGSLNKTDIVYVGEATVLPVHLSPLNVLPGRNYRSS